MEAGGHIRGEYQHVVPSSYLFTYLPAPLYAYAYADQDPDSEVSRRRGPDFFRLRYRTEKDRVVASSGVPQPDGDWSVLPYRRVLEIRRGDLRVSVATV